MLNLSSPALPIGSYSYSDGLEWAVEINCVNSEESLKIGLMKYLEIIIRILNYHFYAIYMLILFQMIQTI